jgi:hypothetical protein
MIPCDPSCLYNRPLLYFSGAACNSKRDTSSPTKAQSSAKTDVSDSGVEDSTFDINATQYTSFYKIQRHLSLLPIRAHFDSERYKNSRKPVPNDNTSVAVSGFVSHVETDESGLLARLHVSVDNICFLGRSLLSTSNTSTEGMLSLTLLTPTLLHFSQTVTNRFSTTPPLHSISIQLALHCISHRLYYSSDLYAS